MLFEIKKQKAETGTLRYGSLTFFGKVKAMIDDGVAVLPLEGFSSFEMAAVCDCLAEARGLSGSGRFSLTVCAGNDQYVCASDGIFSLKGIFFPDIAPRKFLIVLLSSDQTYQCNPILRQIIERWHQSGSYILLVGAAPNVRKFWSHSSGPKYQAANASRFVGCKGVVDGDVHFVTGGLGLLDELLDYVRREHSSKLMSRVSGHLLHRGHRSVTPARYLEKTLRDSLPWVGPLLDELDKKETVSIKKRLSGAAGVSERQLERICRSNLMMSPMEFWNFVRLHRAHNDIVTSFRSIAEIARDAGYQSQSQFSKAYRRSFGSTPLIARQQAMSVVH